MEYQTIIVEVANHVATITLNRPDKLNAFNQQMCDEFEHLWNAIRLDDDVRVVVLRANGERAFCTGVDVRAGIDLAPNVWSQRDPHVSYGITAALEPSGLARRVPLGEALRMALLGLDERMSATRAREIGLVSEVVPGDALRARAAELAAMIAAKPPAAIQGTVKAVWQSLDMTRSGAQEVGMAYTQIGNPIGAAQVEFVADGDRGTLGAGISASDL